MALTVQSGVSAFVERVQAFLTGHGVDASVRLGWVERPKQINQGPGTANRPVIMPSDGAKGGKLGPPLGAGVRPIKNAAGQTIAMHQPIASWTQEFTAYVWGVDSTQSKENDGAQIEPTILLGIWALRGIRVAGQADVVLGSTDWTKPGVQLQYGRELAIHFTLRTPVYDVPEEVVVVRPGPINRTLK
ncbi:MAG: hypothetical protein J0I07_13920 [Myxococcales bacterium]|nr:hypothetical protein [Myxococcales bacterium]